MNNFYDGFGNYLAANGDGSSSDPHIPLVGIDTSVANNFQADETNIISEYLLESGGSSNQNVDGSITPVHFSTSVVPAGKVFICGRVMIYMESSISMDSNKFGNISPLANGWTLALNGVETMNAKTNRELVSQMFDAHGSEIFGKVDRTMIARFSFNKFVPQGVFIRAGQTLSTIVKDDLTGLVYLEARVQGFLKDI